MHPVVMMVVAAFVLQGAETARFTASSLPDGDIVFACRDDMVTLAWDYTLDPDESLGNIEWHRNGTYRQLVATSVAGTFLPAYSFANYVGPAGKAGITLSMVMGSDIGYYTVKINIFGKPGKRTILTSSVFLQIDGQVTTQDGSLQATLADQAVLDPKTDQVAIKLSCGNFTYTWKVPLQANWTTPSGQIVASSDYSDGHFHLLLTSPVKGGNYTCRVPRDRACLSNPQQGEATVYVDPVDARLDLLQKEKQLLTQRLAQTDSELETFKSEHRQAKADMQQSRSQLPNIDTRLDQMESGAGNLEKELADTNSELNRAKSELQGRVENLETKSKKPAAQVGFHAWRLPIGGAPSSKRILFRQKMWVYGQSYNSDTGYFTVPVAGLYFFIAKTGPLRENTLDNHYLMVDDNTVLSHGYSFYRSRFPDGFSVATVHAVARLRARQKVWVKSKENAYRFHADYSSFSGALLCY